MTITELLAAYREGALDPGEVVGRAHAAALAQGAPAWISVVSTPQLRRRLDALGDPAAPLFGVPFAVKDNIDVVGIPTTAGCPAFARTPEVSATVVARLEAAGAVVIGKTNLDQFATGLTGSRSPYGACASVVDPRYVSGGSSSGSAVVVADRTVPFSLGTDTAGSGRVPAAFNGIVGCKPSRGLLSVRGVVPACRSLDCVSVFTRTVADAGLVLAVAQGFDAEDPFSREFAGRGAPSVHRSPGGTRPARLAGPAPAARAASLGPAPAARAASLGPAPAARAASLGPAPAARAASPGPAPAASPGTAPPARAASPAPVTIAVPARPTFCGDAAARDAWGAALARTANLGWSLREFDFAPFAEAAALLYEGPWVAERYAAVGAFVDAHPAGVEPSVAAVIGGGRDRAAAELFAAQHRLAELRREIEPLLATVDALLLPTAPTHPTLAAVAAAPIERNRELGTYTNFVNLLDLCALAVPAAPRQDGLPFGITLMADAGADRRLLELGARWTATCLGGVIAPLRHVTTALADA